MLKKYQLVSEKLKKDHWSSIPYSIKELNIIFKKNGKKLYLVGGCVRDFLTGNTPRDFDLSTDAKPYEVTKMLMDYNGEFFGQKPEILFYSLENIPLDAVGVYSEEHSNVFEISTFSVNVSEGITSENRKNANIEDDVKRRDLTYNGLYYDLEKREIVDLVDGVKDLENGVTRMIGEPLKRLQEDPIRILRAFRFSAICETSLSDDLVLAINKRKLPQNGEIRCIFQNKIWVEFEKAFNQVKSFKNYLEFFNRFDLWQEVFPESIINRDLVEFSELTSYFANLFRYENIQTLQDKMVSNYRIEHQFAIKIVFLIELLNLTSENYTHLYEKKNRLNIENKTIIDWLDSCGITIIYSKILD